jgi:hypothetical protein
VIGPLLTGAGFAFVVGLALYSRSYPPGMSESGLRTFRRGTLFASISLVLFAAIFEIVFFAETFGFVTHRGFLFWLVFGELIINGVAAFSLLSVLTCLFSFSKRDASDVTAIGMTFGVLLGIVEALLCFFGFGLALMD